MGRVCCDGDAGGSDCGDSPPYGMREFVHFWIWELGFLDHVRDSGVIAFSHHLRDSEVYYYGAQPPLKGGV